MKPSFLLWLKPTKRHFILAYLYENYKGAAIIPCDATNIEEKYKELQDPIFITQVDIFNKKGLTDIIRNVVWPNQDAKTIVFGDKMFGKLEKDASCTITSKKNEQAFNGAIKKFTDDLCPNYRRIVCIALNVETLLNIPNPIKDAQIIKLPEHTRKVR